MKIFQQGTAFLLGSPGGKRKHLYAVISDPNLHGGECIAVWFSSDQSPSESGKPLILNHDDHPWISHITFVRFDRPLLLDPKHQELIRKAGASIVAWQSPLKTDVLKRIVEHGRKCSDFPAGLKKFLL